VGPPGPREIRNLGVNSEHEIGFEMRNRVEKGVFGRLPLFSVLGSLKMYE